jgi:hypothetical protein
MILQTMPTCKHRKMVGSKKEKNERKEGTKHAMLPPQIKKT